MHPSFSGFKRKTEIFRLAAKAGHAYYIHAFKFDEKKAGIHRNKFVQAVSAELMPIELRKTEGNKIGCGYMRCLCIRIKLLTVLKVSRGIMPRKKTAEFMTIQKAAALLLKIYIITP